MKCKKCGSELEAGVKFCTECGEPVGADAPAVSAKTEKAPAEKPKRKRKPTVSKMMKEGAPVSENIFLCEDGKYRWVYEMPILKNPTIFIMVWKILFFIILGIFAFTFIFDLIDGNLTGETALNTLKFFGYFVLGMTVLLGIAMLLYAAIMGGKYVVMFEMDSDGVNHKQMPKQVKKAQAIGIITALAGIAARNVTTVGVGINAAARSEMYSRFIKVRKVKAYPRRDLIKVNQLLTKNQVYAEKEDFDFVYNYILDHTPNRKNNKTKPAADNTASDNK